MKNPIRIVTAASLFDGHDVSINIIRRMLQDAGCEVIHLGHNRSVKDVVCTALQEAAQTICISNYQGGHVAYFKYTRDLLDQNGATYVKIFGGGGGLITPNEKKELEDYGVSRIFRPEDGKRLGLEGMIQEIVKASDFDICTAYQKSKSQNTKLADKTLLADKNLGLKISELENKNTDTLKLPHLPYTTHKKSPLVLGVTGTGGAGKSSLVDELLFRMARNFVDIKIGIICIDPTKRKTGGALLGDRIRMNALSFSNFFMRSLASRKSGKEISDNLKLIIPQMKNQGFDLLIVETSGIGQGNMAITEVSDLSLYVMTSEFGASSQLEKIDMIDFADFIAINKSDRQGSKDALRDVRKQYKRSRKLFQEEDSNLPVFLTQASHFNDEGMNHLFLAILKKIGIPYSKSIPFHSKHQQIIPTEKKGYLTQVAQTVRTYKEEVQQKADSAYQLGALEETLKLLPHLKAEVEPKIKELIEKLDDDYQLLKSWNDKQKTYQQDNIPYSVMGKTKSYSLKHPSLSGTMIRRVVFPRFKDMSEKLKFLKLENVPGEFPYTAGIWTLKRQDEDPQRQFAGEGTPEKTNKRFHYLCKNTKAKRLSTAFDSVTLYGEDPALRPDIYSRIGECGVSICTLDNMKTLYSGFDLCDPSTSVSMTINGPAPIILAFFMNTAIDQQIEKREKELKRDLTKKEIEDIKAKTFSSVRGTVQADILKEEQAQNTCIFSTDFALKMMGDIQEYFILNKVRHFYSVSISGYHIAEAGANPITQTAFTLANAFTYVEYYLSRGMKIDQFAPHLSLFFSNGLDPEYVVIGRVARRIWAITIRYLYGGSSRSQKLKYHIQTSGRSLHSEEMSFNDIRTTLQALIAIYDNCNSLHTNSYDEAITTPTKESVRRAMAIQMIINREFGMTKCENSTQGSYWLEQLTDLVEEAILSEFIRISERGGVLPAIELGYQRGKIQEESLYYEHLKHSGQLPIIGVNTYISEDDDVLNINEKGLSRSTKAEKNKQLKHLELYQQKHQKQAKKELEYLKEHILSGKNIFEALMQASNYCSLGQMSKALYEVGGAYRRSV